MTDSDRLLAKLAEVDDKLSLLLQGQSKTRVSPANLGFGKRSVAAGEDLIYVFVNQPNHPLTGDRNDFWYWRTEREDINYGIKDDDLTGFISSVYRRDSLDKVGKNKPVLNVHVEADKQYVLQMGFYTNFASSLLAALAELPAEAVLEPLTVRVEQTPGKNSYPTTFCQIEWRGKRVDRKPDSSLNKALLTQIQERFGFHNPLEAARERTENG